MDRDSAAKLEGMLLGGRLHLHAIADHVRGHVPEQDRRAYLLKIGTAMTELPYPEETRLAQQMRKDAKDSDPSPR